MKLLITVSLGTVAVLTVAPTDVQANGVYTNAETCAERYLDVNPTLHTDWVQGTLLGLLGGQNDAQYVGVIKTTDTDLPQLNMMDGPQGIRNIVSRVPFAGLG
jgi:hypothetical protein